MKHFVDSYKNKVDGKGRVSVPAPFRAVLKLLEASPVLMLRPVWRPLYNAWCLDVCTLPEFEQMQAQVEKFEEGSEARIEKERDLYANTSAAEIDGDGRILISPKLITKVGLKEVVVFAGLGKRFQIWEEAAGEAFLAGTPVAA
jgi:MraZ protein